MNEIGPVLTFLVGEETFAVPVSGVQEILDLCQVSRLPGAPRHIRGLIDVRGDAVAVIDLRRIMGLGDGEDDAQTRMIVLLVPDGAGDLARVAMRADRVFEVTALDQDRIDPLPAADLLRWKQASVSGIGRRNGDFVALLDIKGMVNSFPPPRQAA